MTAYRHAARESDLEGLAKAVFEEKVVKKVKAEETLQFEEAEKQRVDQTRFDEINAAKVDAEKFKVDTNESKANEDTGTVKTVAAE